ncbi:exonuclease domain-containing protein [Allorhodopirellula solitaria]|uniref:Exodeoxyribonuclease 10 n=1 Tax=Allorhodopirellula solitaria TaxID=2527987 RepID=A0A5C5WMS3_9BACT|nr:exonuclease domain-containing protein [Allorhodopirellula solitaria]TWT52114.1 Exodeoxyribonuclease 10 [Allorhodopirellula solitaria]
MDFTAIDFETATHQSDSACQLAAVRVRDHEIVDTASWLIRPRPFYISPRNIAIHGITPGMVSDAPEFEELWPEIATQFGDDCLIAHNASFDMGVLLACLRTHGHPVPEMQYSCTRAIARRTWPDQPRFGLKPLSDWLGIEFRHHDALEDSIACAKIALSAAEHIGAQTLEQLEEKLKLNRGVAGSWGKTGPSMSRRRSTRSTAAASQRTEAQDPDVLVSAAGVDLQRLFVRAQWVQPLAGQRVVFTGVLSRIERADAEQLAQLCGGRCVSSVSKLTNLLVVGQSDPRTLRSGRSQSTKELKVQELNAQGANVRVLSEDEFLRLISQSL